MPKTPSTPQATTPANRLIAPRFMFRFSVDVHRREPLWPVRGVKVKGPLLDPSYRLIAPGELDGERTLADVRMGWSPEGLLWTVQVEGKRQTPWCRESRPTESDGLQVWVDTRASRDIHRASRYCHRFIYLPCGGGRGAAEPVAEQLLIHRARENARPVRPRELQVRATTTSKGYELAAFAPAQVLAGFDPENQPRLGFTLAVLDRELGLQTFATGAEFPYEEDPSCWAELELVE
ncbi:MAG: hypothetical protein ABGX16_16350 [Pirellulales bacterium]